MLSGDPLVGMVDSIIPDEQGQLWLSTSEGLSRFTPKTGEILNITQEDGLINDVFSAFKWHKARKQ